MSRLNTTLNAAQCPRCKGRGQIAADDDPDMILSCPDCEGTGEAEDPLDDLGGMDGWLL